MVGTDPENQITRGFCIAVLLSSNLCGLLGTSGLLLEFVRARLPTHLNQTSPAGLHVRIGAKSHGKALGLAAQLSGGVFSEKSAFSIAGLPLCEAPRLVLSVHMGCEHANFNLSINP